MSSSIQIHTLTDGGQKPLDVARMVAGFLEPAQRSLDLAQYDFNLGPETREVVAGAIQAATKRGVAVRIIYNVDHGNPIPVPPPCEPDVALITSLGVPEKAIAGIPDLMHHKFVVRDGESVWTGSMNWTDDSWSRQENVVIAIDSPELAKAFTIDFEELWKIGDVEKSGFAEPRPVEVDGTRVRPWFTPGFADALTHRIAKKIGHAERIRICSPVITSAPILATLAQRIADGRGDIAGCVDATQVDDVVRQWRKRAERGLEAAAPRIACSAASSPGSGRSRGTRSDRCTTSCTPSWSSRTTPSSWARSTSRTRARRTPRTSSRSPSAELAAQLAEYADTVRARYPQAVIAAR